MARLDPEAYAGLQQQMSLFAGLVRDWRIDDFIETAQHANEIGVFLDPRLWMRANGKLDDVLALARSIQGVQREVQRQLAALTPTEDGR